MGLLYRSQYLDLVVTGRTYGGERFALVTGKHDERYPYDHPESRWDDFLLAIGDERVSLHAPRLEALRYEMDARGPAEGPARIVYEGPALRPDGREARVRFELPYTYRRFRPFQLGKRYNVFDWEAVPGMRWQPFQLASCGPQRVSIDGVTWELAQSFGEIELGVMSNLRVRKMAFRYDYLALVSSEPAYAYVRFVGRALYPDGCFGRLFDAYMRWSASETLTIEGDALHRGDKHGVEPNGPELDVLVRHTVPLGLADLERRLVETRDGRGHAALGLLEIFTAR